MATWDEIFQEVQPAQCIERKINDSFKQLTKETGRNAIIYLSAWQQKPGINGNFSIDDNDRNGFMSVLNGIDKKKGLDLILHTPGGDLAATKSIVEYLSQFFNDDIRVIVPHTAMSAGTMIACAAKEIYLGLHSNLGPIDPQIGGAPANEYLKLLKNAQNDYSANKNIRYWQEVLQKYPPTFFGQCENAINVSKKYVYSWLERNMLKGVDAKAINETVEYLANYDYHLQHNTRLHINELRDKTCLKIVPLEENGKLQDLFLTIYHCILIYVNSSPCSKIIMNQKGKTFITNHN